MATAKRLQKAIYRASGDPCPYCGQTMLKTERQADKRNPTRDHIFPKIRGGRRTLIVCQRCNTDKAHYALREWLAVLMAAKDKRSERIRVLCRIYADEAGEPFPPGFMCIVPARPETRGRTFQCGSCGSMHATFHKVAYHYVSAHRCGRAPALPILRGWEAAE